MNSIVVTATISLLHEDHWTNPAQHDAKVALAHQYGWVTGLCPDDQYGWPDTGNQDHRIAFDKLINHDHSVMIECEVTREGKLIPIRIL